MNLPKISDIFREEFNLKKFVIIFILIFISTITVNILRQSQIIEIPQSPPAKRKGPDNAKIKIFEFSDLGCPACALAHLYLKQAIEIYKYDIQLNFKNYPLIDLHPNSFAAAIYAECASRQNKFWEFVDILFQKQNEWTKASNYNEIFKTYANTIGINLGEFNNCVDNKEIEKNIKLDISYGNFKNVDATPTFFVNNERAVGVSQVMQKISKYLNK